MSISLSLSEIGAGGSGSGTDRDCGADRDALTAGDNAVTHSRVRNWIE
jgi:hypothetical protein